MRPDYPPRHRWVIALATVLAVVLAGRLCAWQLSRAAQKETLQAALDSRAGLPPTV